MSDFGAALVEAWSESGLGELSAAQISPLEAHWTLLARWNAKMNLTAVRSLPEAVRVHYCECLYARVALGPLPQGTRIVDLGSGAGFPGVPLAVLYPHCDVALVDSNQRKAVFLRESTRGLPNVRVIATRFEALPGQWDWIVSRAVRPEDVLSHMPRLAPRVILFPGPQDLDLLIHRSCPHWSAPIPLPWGEGRYLLSGSVP